LPAPCSSCWRLHICTGAYPSRFRSQSARDQHADLRPAGLDSVHQLRDHRIASTRMRGRDAARARVRSRGDVGTASVRWLRCGPAGGRDLCPGPGARLSARRPIGHACDDELACHVAHDWLLRLIHFADRGVPSVRASLQRTPFARMGRLQYGHRSPALSIHRHEPGHGRLWSAPVRHGYDHLGLGGRATGSAHCQLGKNRSRDRGEAWRQSGSPLLSQMFIASNSPALVALASAAR
jgi:hypothetical protein